MRDDSTGKFPAATSRTLGKVVKSGITATIPVTYPDLRLQLRK